MKLRPGRRQLEGVYDDVAVFVDCQKFLSPVNLFARRCALAVWRIDIIPKGHHSTLIMYPKS